MPVLGTVFKDGGVSPENEDLELVKVRRFLRWVPEMKCMLYGKLERKCPV